MHEIRALENNWRHHGRTLHLKGFDRLVPVSKHHSATRRQVGTPVIPSAALAHG
jgi:hypothetical protein